MYPLAITATSRWVLVIELNINPDILGAHIPRISVFGLTSSRYQLGAP